MVLVALFTVATFCTNCSVFDSCYKIRHTYIFWILRHLGKVERSSFMQYCRAPSTQRLMYSSTVTASKSMGNRILSVGDCSDTSPKKLVLSKIHSLVVKNCSSSNPSLIFLINRTMLQTNHCQNSHLCGVTSNSQCFLPEHEHEEVDEVRRKPVQE